LADGRVYFFTPDRETIAADHAERAERIAVETLAADAGEV
jgi:hypothetical protein